MRISARKETGQLLRILSQLRPNSASRTIFFWSVLLVALWMAGYSYAAPGKGPSPSHDTTLREMQDKINASTDKARKYERQVKIVNREISNLRQDLVTAAAKKQATESGIYNTEKQLDQLSQQEKNLKNRLQSRHIQMAKTLAAMQRLSEQPVELIAYRPEKVINSLRSASLLKILQPELKKRAAAIQQDITDLSEVREKILQESAELKILLAALSKEQIEMNQLLAERRKKQRELRRATRQERHKLKQFAAKAKNIQDLIARIEQERQIREKAARDAARRLARDSTGKKTKPLTKSARLRLNSPPGAMISFRKAKGTMPLPAQGAIKRTFGDRAIEGMPAKGITIHTLPRATVVSPHDGRIVFAGKFRTYGQLLIIAHGQEYHTLLAGMTRLDAEVGQWVLKGEPIGQMSADITNIKNTNTEKTLSPNGQNLYVELRRMGKPINPLPWIMARDRKVL